MAIISFTQNIIIKDELKIRDFKKNLSTNSKNFQNIKTNNALSKNTKKISKIWFKTPKDYSKQ